MSGAATLTENSQMLKYIPEISNELFIFIVFWQIAFTVLGIHPEKCFVESSKILLNQQKFPLAHI